MADTKIGDSTFTDSQMAMFRENCQCSVCKKIREERKKEEEKTRYGLTLVFEVNDPGGKAFINQVHNLDVSELGGGDYGHAAFYLSTGTKKTMKVTNSFSFGPKAGSITKKLNQGLTSKAIPEESQFRPGTANYWVTEAVKVFRIALTQAQYDTLNQRTNQYRQQITSGALQYAVIINDTCAAIAAVIVREVLSALPPSFGTVRVNVEGKLMGSTVDIPSVSNPYMWHHKLLQAGYREFAIGQTDSKRMAIDMMIQESTRGEDPLSVEHYPFEALKPNVPDNRVLPVPASGLPFAFSS